MEAICPQAASDIENAIPQHVQTDLGFGAMHKA
eukprot:CAMPEP_0204086766 /NCGR_PEP_ID=MMETSP0360-20130528/183544_1 /ASSEMBLY_ACC=CAM_ASM_000342 /TAXON_ID=268821 /ORGANISM="Scrippsiella Hangoei, Strain SHTV-5" /LENGTH=32 /DNA_ID= /DNA_START= /DNA_END= /DNA_ORIENTATION=